VEHIQRLNQSFQKWKDIHFNPSNRISSYPPSSVPLYSNMMFLLEETTHSKQCIDHIKTGYPEISLILDNIRVAEDKHNQKVISFIKDTIDPIDSELEKLQSSKNHGNTNSLLIFHTIGIPVSGGLGLGF
jgi:hypothetical protein